MKKFHSFAGILLSLSVFLLLLLGGCNEQNAPTTDEKTLSGLGIARVEFGVTADGTTISDHSIRCSDTVLKSANTPKVATVYYEPEEPITKPAFSSDTYKLDTYEYGTFTLNRREKADDAPVNLSDVEAIRIAEEFLQEYGLYCDDLKPSENVGEDKSVGTNGSVITGKVVHFYPKTEDGVPLFGNSHVSVRLAADKQITQVIYNHIHYKKEAVLTLMTPQQALERAKASTDPTEVLLDAEDNLGKELTIANIRLAYYENVTRTTPTRQPVYVFEGGESDTPFAICIPAAQP